MVRPNAFLNINIVFPPKLMNHYNTAVSHLIVKHNLNNAISVTTLLKLILHFFL